MIPMSLPEIVQEDVLAVAEVVRSGRLSLGPRTEEFEQLVAAYCGVRCGVAVSSGTAGLHLALASLDLAAGDEVLVPSFTFAATVNAILFVGAKPVFVDIDPTTYNLAPDDAEKKISKRTRAIVVVDVFGHPAEWGSILNIARRHGLRVVDDACEGIGAEYRGKPLGGLGDATVFGFYPNKQITTGEGGMIVTNDDDIARVCRSLRNQGRNEMGARLRHDRLGYNYRLNEMSAALGVSQFRRLESTLKKRQRVAALYSSRLETVERVLPPVVRPHVRMSWFAYVVRIDEGMNRDPVMQKMASRGIPSRGYFPPAHLQAYIRSILGCREGELPVTEAVAKRTIALPFHNNLTEEQVDQVVEVLASAIRSSDAR